MTVYSVLFRIQIDKGVMVIGDGLSGRDIVRLLSGTAKKIILVTHTVKVRPRQAKTVEVKFEEGHLREGFDCLTETGVDFPDGTTELLDAVIYATGITWKCFSCSLFLTNCSLSISRIRFCIPIFGYGLRTHMEGQPRATIV